MSWGTELWDQYENLSMHTQKGVDFLEKYGHFIKDRCAIEMEYAAKLRRLVKSYQPKKKEEEDHQYTPCKAFREMMTEVNDLAGQHELIAENLQAEVIREVFILIKDFKDERKKLLAEGARMMSQLTNQIATLERARKNYEKAAKEAERAHDNYKRADADLNLSRAEVEKQRMNMTMKSQQCEDAKNEYADQLQRTNDQQHMANLLSLRSPSMMNFSISRSSSVYFKNTLSDFFKDMKREEAQTPIKQDRQHYQYKMPDVFRQLQELDEKRIRSIRNFMVQSAQVERNVFPIINKCLDGIVNAANKINEKEDSLLVIERYKSGFEPPGDIPFEDLNRVDGNHHPLTIHPTPITIKPESITVKGTMSASKLKKRGVLFGIFSSNKNNLSGSGDNKEDYSDLPPNQRKKKLQMKIDEIQAKIHQETAARDGLMKMKGVYEANSQLGDPMSIEGQLHESGQRLDKLRQELHKYQSYLDETGPVTNTPSHHNTLNGLRRHHRNSGGSGGEDDSLSRSASDSSVSANHKHSAPGTPLPNHGASDSPESGIGASHTSLPDSDDAPPPYYDTELLPPLGTCRALYPFEATSEGSIAMADGEELLVIEVDQGDGWTRVRRPADSTEGFVPTSYIQCVLNNC